MLNYNNLDKSWLDKLNNDSSLDNISSLNSFLIKRKSEGAVIYPKPENIFRALELSSLNDIKVVILGQDPYHGPNQAHGLSFSVQKEITKLPPSLKNIYKELADDLNADIPTTGFLEPWAKQGVLLLNAVLTVEQSDPNSHSKKGWETFTDSIIQTISDSKENIVFILWGAYAQKKEELINSSKHLIIKSPHPSPFSARKGFFGSKPFSKTNTYLSSNNLKPITWEL